MMMMMLMMITSKQKLSGNLAETAQLGKLGSQGNNGCGATESLPTPFKFDKSKDGHLQPPTSSERT